MISQRRLSREFADRLRCWHPSGFQVYCGPPVDRDDQPALERLSAYILRPSFAGTRLQYDADNGQIEYRTTKGLIRRMDGLDWIALVTSHIPDPISRWSATPAVTRMPRGVRDENKVSRHPGRLPSTAPRNPTQPPGISPGNGAATGPPLLPHKLDSFLATLSPRQRQQVRASTDSVFWDDVPVYRG